MNNHITQIDKFNSETIDHDIIVSNKTYFNIYNNSLDEPFHKFWFFIENAKLTNIYNENSVFRFALNNKSDKNKKLIEYLKNLLEYIKNLFIGTYPEIVVDTPWKEYDNYPCMINFIANDNTICLDSKENTKNISEISKDQTYSVLFELTYIQVAKIIIGEKTNHSLKFKFNLIMVQEKLFDKKVSLLENINQINNFKPKNNYVPQYANSNPNSNSNPNPSSNILMKSVLGELTESNNKSLKNVSVAPNRPTMRFSLNANDLLNKKNALNKIGVKEIKGVEDDKNIPEYLEQKNKLKKVETDERSLITILKREYDEISLQNNEQNNIKELQNNKKTECINTNLLNTKKEIDNNKKINLIEKSNKLDELDGLDELDELDFLNKNLNTKNKEKINNNSTNYPIVKNNLEAKLEEELEVSHNSKSKNSKKKLDNKIKKKSEKKNDFDLDMDLDLEFENITKN